MVQGSCLKSSNSQGQFVPKPQTLNPNPQKLTGWGFGILGSRAQGLLLFRGLAFLGQAVPWVKN